MPSEYSVLLNYIWTVPGTLILNNLAPSCQLRTYLIVHEYVHDVLVDLPSQTVLRPPGENYKLNSQQRHQNQSGSDSLHVHVGLGPVCVSQLGHQHSYDI